MKINNRAVVSGSKSSLFLKRSNMVGVRKVKIVSVLV